MFVEKDGMFVEKDGIALRYTLA